MLRFFLRLKGLTTIVLLPHHTEAPHAFLFVLGAQLEHKGLEANVRIVGIEKGRVFHLDHVVPIEEIGQVF